MKRKLLYKTVLLLFIIIVSGCEDSLDLINPTQYTEESYFVNAEELQKSVVAIYAGFYFETLQQRGWYHIFDGMGNEGILTSGANYRAYYYFNHTPDEANVTRLWNELYRIVIRANLTIEKASNWNPTTETDKALKPVLIGQARCLRAYAYFNLVTLFGRVPLRDTYDDRLNYNMPRASTNDIYALIDSDLEYSANNLPAKWDNSNKGRVTSGTALALWGKTYLYRKDYKKSREKFEYILANEGVWGYDLHPNYKELFQAGNAECPGDNSAESVFEVQFTSTQFMESQWYWFGGTEGTFPNAHSGHARWYSFKGWGAIFIPKVTCRAFTYSDESNNKYIDPRASLTFYDDGTFGGDTNYGDNTPTPKTIKLSDMSNKRWYKKYTRMEYVLTETTGGSTINEKVIRYADVLLMCAESMIEDNAINQALPLINRVRKRVGAFEYTSLGNKQQAMEKLKLERRLELCGEQHRYFDLVRWGDLVTVGNSERAQYIVDGDEPTGTAANPIKDYHILFPIPQLEIDLNSAIANDVGNNWN